MIEIVAHSILPWCEPHTTIEDQPPSYEDVVNNNLT